MPDPAMQYEEPEDRGMGLADMIEAIFRHKRLGLLVFLAVMGGTLVHLSYREDLFASWATISVVPGIEQQPADLVAADQSASNQVPARENAMVALEGTALAEKVVGALGPGAILSGRPSGEPYATLPRLRVRVEKTVDGVLAALFGRAEAKAKAPAKADAAPSESLLITAREVVRSSLTVKRAGVEGWSDALTLKYVAGDPKVAQAILSKLIEIFKEYYADVTKPDPKAVAVSEARRNAAEKQYRDARKRLADQEGQIGSADLEAKKKQLAELEREIAEGEGRVESLKTGVAALERELAGRSVVDGELLEEEDNPDYKIKAEELHQAETELALLLNKYNEKSPAVKDQRTKVDLLKKQLEGLDKKVVRKKPLDNDKALADQAKSLQEKRVDLQEAEVLQAGRLRRLPGLRTDVEKLEVENRKLAELRATVDAEKREFDRADSALSQVKLALALKEAGAVNVKVLSGASLTLWPEGTRRRTIVLVAAVLGLIAGMGAAILRDMFRRSFKNAREVEERLGVPAVATVPDASRHNLARLPRS
ncbi:MAG: hypothetical protein AB1486_11710 [Planctomycetota bacterium]